MDEAGTALRQRITQRMQVTALNNHAAFAKAQRDFVSGLEGGACKIRIIETLDIPFANPMSFVDPSGLASVDLVRANPSLQHAADLTDPKGVYSVAAHGSPKSVLDETTGIQYNAQDFAKLLIDHYHYAKNSGTPVLLLSCQTGSGPNSFAQQLASALGAAVYAPDTNIENYVAEDNGQLAGVVLFPNGLQGGQFYKFSKDSNPIPVGQDILSLPKY